MKRKNRTYVVFKGRKPGIYTTWAEAESEVLGYSGAVHRSYQDISLAESAFKSGDPKFGVEVGERNGDLAMLTEVCKCYAVFVGRKIGIFSTLQEAEEQTESYPEGFYEIYNNREEAIKALERFFIGVPAETTSNGDHRYITNKI